MNRYTQFTPQQYVESFVETPTMDFPFQEAFAAQQYNNKRNDELMSQIGAVEGADIEGGYLTGDIASAYNKERRAATADLAAKMSGDFNRGQIVKELSSLSSKYASDSRRKLAVEDAALKGWVAKTMGDPTYGTSTFFQAMQDPSVKDRINKGEIGTIDPSTYGLLTDPGKMATFDPVLDNIKEDLFSGYSIGEDGKYIETGTTKVLDWETVQSRIAESFNMMRNEDGSINMEQALSPEMQKYIQFRQGAYAKDGITYDWNNLVDDISGVAALRYNTQIKKNIKGAGSSKKGKDTEVISEDSKLLSQGNYIPSPSESIETYDKLVESINRNNSEIIKSEGTEYYLVSPNEDGGENRFNLNQLTSSDETVKANAANTVQGMLMKNEEKNIRDKVKTIDTGYGKTSLYEGQPITEEDINKKIAENYNARLGQVVKLAKATHEAKVGVLNLGMELPDNKDLQELKRLDKEAQEINNSLSRSTILYPVYNSKISEIRKKQDAIKNKPGVKEYNKILNAEILKLNSNPEIASVGMTILPKEKWNTSTNVPQIQIDIDNMITAAVKLGNSPVGKLGENYDNFYTSDEKGKGIKKLKLANSDDTGDFSNGSFQGVQLVWDPTNRKDKEGNQTSNGRWLVRGNFIGQDSNKNQITSELLDLDVTKEMNMNPKILSMDEAYSTFLQDMALDNIMMTVEGVGMNAATGLSLEDEERFGGGLFISKDVNKRYTINGNVALNGQIVPLSDPKVIKDFGLYSNRNLSESDAINLLGGAIKTRLENTATVKRQGTTDPTDTVKLLENAGVPPSRSQSVNEAFSAIESVESGSASFDAMNTGGGNAGLTAYGSTTGTEKFKKPLTQMTMKEVMDLQKEQRDPKTNELIRPKQLHAAGKFQVIPETMVDAYNALGLNPDDTFNEVTQTKIANYLFERRAEQLVTALKSKRLGNTIRETDVERLLFDEGVKDPKTGEIFGYMSSEWRGLRGANAENKEKVLNAVKEYLSDKHSITVS